MEGMKATAVLYYYRPERRNGLCRSFNTKHCAITSAIYSLVKRKVQSFGNILSILRLFLQNISILVVLLYSWQVNVNAKKFHILAEVYYGVQISYFAIIGSHLSIILLSIALFFGINTVSTTSLQSCMKSSFGRDILISRKHIFRWFMPSRQKKIKSSADNFFRPWHVTHCDVEYHTKFMQLQQFS
jgi:hypothetical protein